MANSDFYQKLIKVVSEYVDAETAAAAIGRQLKHTDATPESFQKKHLNEILSRVVTVTTLYLKDDATKSALENKIKGMM